MRLVGHAFELPDALSPNEAGSLSILKEAPCMCDIGVNLWLCGCAWLVMLCAFQCLRSPQTHWSAVTNVAQACFDPEPEN